ncbi:MAG TPA: sulfur carrier protein ThiS [Chthonomonadaceae bacterium]|nr:sulfur carrier protein ThiS [Chthonomonadaceae bacterium]
MTLNVNGETREQDGSITIAGFLASLGLNATMVVVERNRLIVPRSEFERVELADGDELEIVQMMAGG